MLYDLLMLSLCLLPGPLPNLSPANTVIESLYTSPIRPISPGIRIGWDHRTLTQVSSPRFGYSSYPRMIQLRDGSLICVYEADGSIMASASIDLGMSWQAPTPVAWHQDGTNMAAPDVLQLQDNSILVCYNPRPWKISGSRTFGIRTRKSYDGGKTWIHGRLLYEAGHKFGDGCWEPSAIQLPNGEIQLFFANEGIFRNTGEQNISLLRSRDSGLTWTEKPETVSYRQWGRDGMPSPLLLRNRTETVCAIEDTGLLGHFKPAIIRSTKDNDWSEPTPAVSPFRSTALLEAIGYDLYAGAPYLRQLKTGETLLSYQGTENRRNRMHFADMKVVIGDADARHFNRKSVPFNIPRDKQALWNSLTVLDDGTVVALTSTNAFSPRSQVWMIKGHVIPEIVATQHTLKIDGRQKESFWKTPLPIFVGRDGPTWLRAGLAYDDKYLNMVVHVDDDNVSCDSASPENNDGVSFSLSLTSGPSLTIRGMSHLADAQPTTRTVKFFLSADNTLVAKAGKNGKWMEVDAAAGNFAGIKHATHVTPGGYVQEIAVPWLAVGGPPAHGAPLLFNLTLTENSGRNVPDYRESISACDEDKPFTWVPLGLP